MDEISENLIFSYNVDTLKTSDANFAHIVGCKKDIENGNILQNVKHQLCRVCGRKRTALLPIFGAHLVNEVPVSHKIEMHLPIKIKNDDSLPLNICMSCNTMVQAWHDLHVSCVAADTVLRRMFTETSNIVSNDCHLANCKEKSTEEISLIQGNDADISEEECSTVSVHSTKGILKTECSEKLIECKQKNEKQINIFSKDSSQNYSHRTKCGYCAEYFESFKLKLHKLECQLRVTMCELCGVCVQMRYLKSHVAKVHVKTLLCEICGEFFSSYNLKKHKDECILEPTSYCEPCCRLFYSEHGYQSHMKEHSKGAIQHLGVKIKASIQDEFSLVYHCPVCEDCFSDKLSAIVHLNSCKITTCKPCKKDFRNERTFLAHICIPQKKLWHCRHCFKAFERKYSWQIHERTHGGSKPFSCKMCGKNYPSLENLLQHSLNHGSTSFECSYCKKRFNRQFLLKEHVLYHEGFIYKCKICEKQFRTSYSLRAHCVYVHGKIKTRHKS